MQPSIVESWRAIAENETDFIVNCSQLCALIIQQVDDLSWCGFYWHRDEMLVVGSYQGPLACTRIDVDRGVCGAAFSQAQTQVVADVSVIHDHIACDSGSASEIVVPIIKEGVIIGVFDIDSYTLNRFDAEFAMHLERLIESFVASTQFPPQF